MYTQVNSGAQAQGKAMDPIYVRFASKFRNIQLQNGLFWDRDLGSLELTYIKLEKRPNVVRAIQELREESKSQGVLVTAPRYSGTTSDGGSILLTPLMRHPCIISLTMVEHCVCAARKDWSKLDAQLAYNQAQKLDVDERDSFMSNLIVDTVNQLDSLHQLGCRHPFMRLQDIVQWTQIGYDGRPMRRFAVNNEPLFGHLPDMLAEQGGKPVKHKKGRPDQLEELFPRSDDVAALRKILIHFAELLYRKGSETLSMWMKWKLLFISQKSGDVNTDEKYTQWVKKIDKILTRFEKFRE